MISTLRVSNVEVAYTAVDISKKTIAIAGSNVLKSFPDTQLMNCNLY
jgi:hypothetical protein